MAAIPSETLSKVRPWNIDDVDKSARSIKSAERTLALFELFSLEQRALTVGELSKRLGIPQPSVTMLLRNLVKLGYLEHDRFLRNYVPTIRIMLLGSWVHRRMARQGDLETHLDWLVSETRETVTVAIQNGIYSQYVSAQLPDDPHRMEVQSGLLRPITRTAVGRILLSRLPDTEITMIMRRCNAEVAPELRVEPAEFASVIALARKQGYATTDGDMTHGFSAVAIAVNAGLGKIPVAVGVGGPTERINGKRGDIIKTVQEFKRKIEARSDGAPDCVEAGRAGCKPVGA